MQKNIFGGWLKGPAPYLLGLFSLVVLLACPLENDTQPDVEPPPGAGRVRAPTLSHNTGLYPEPFELEITTKGENSIYYSIDGSIPRPSQVGKGLVFKYEGPIRIEDRNGKANLVATKTNSENMYGFTNDPRGSMPGPYVPTKEQVAKASVIRAVSVSPLGKLSDVVTATYFLGNNLEKYGNNPVISIVTEPENLFSTETGIFVRGKGKAWDGEPTYNFRKKGKDWERPANFDFFNANRKVDISTIVGIRVRGGWSRAHGQKSLNIYFRDEYGGIKNLKDYDLIPGAVQADGRPLAKYKSVMLRNGANDADYTKFYDVFLQRLLKDRSFTTQAGIPIVLFINGEYWGPYNLQERYSDNHTEYKYDVAKENVISYDNWELDDGMPGEEKLYQDMVDMQYTKDFTKEIDYQDFCDIFDIDNFIDYFASQIYIYNEDWPHNNFRLWRTRNEEAGNPYGDTKWRWQMFDVEFALGIYNGGELEKDGKDSFSRLVGEKGGHAGLFNALMKNQSFKKYFVRTMMDLVNHTFHPSVYTPVLDDFFETYKPLMLNDYYNRWLGGGWYLSQFKNKTDDAKKFLDAMNSKMVEEYLPTYCGVKSEDLKKITLKIDGPTEAVIQLNSIQLDLSADQWEGKYYTGIPLSLKASAPAGYAFESWEIIGGTATQPTEAQTDISFSGDVEITAKFIQK